VRFLIDESLSTTVARLLSDAGHDAVHVGDLGLLGAADGTVMRAASAADRVLVSADTDFGELLALGSHPGPSVSCYAALPIVRPPKRDWSSTAFPDWSGTWL
jgi:predicted nuclease of predicted toxin-antitoxin system